VSTRFFLLLDVKVACFADSWIVLLQEVLQTPHAHFDELATSWAGHLSINDSKVVIGSLVNPSECQQFTNLCRLTIVVPAPSPGSNKRSIVPDMVLVMTSMQVGSSVRCMCKRGSEQAQHLHFLPYSLFPSTPNDA